MGNIQHLATWWDEAGILRQEIGFILQAVLAHSFPDVLNLLLLDLFPDILSLKQNEWLSSIELMALDGFSGGFLFDKAGVGRSAPFHYAEDNCSPFCARALLQFRRPLKLISLDWPNSNFVRQLFCRPPSQNATQLLTNALQRFEQSQSHPDCGYVSTFNVSRFVSLVKSGRNKQNVFLSSICTLCAWSSAKVATHIKLETATKSCND